MLCAIGTRNPELSIYPTSDCIPYTSCCIPCTSCYIPLHIALPAAVFLPAHSESLLKLLKELPSTLVGRLLFEADIPPSLLKESLHSLGMNMIQLALQCCCSPLTVKSGETRKGGPSAVIPLNGAGNGVQADGHEGWKTLDPCQLSYELLTHVVQVLRGVCVCVCVCVCNSQVSQ